MTEEPFTTIIQRLMNDVPVGHWIVPILLLLLIVAVILRAFTWEGTIVFKARNDRNDKIPRKSRE